MILLVILSLVTPCLLSVTNPTVVTPTGVVKGFHVSETETDVFLGIPFAKPPVGPLRFRLPEPVAPWSGVLDATKYANACYQVLFSSDFAGDTMWNPLTSLSEDCLYLNVWVPTPRRAKVPVMVWIHGGGLTSGSAARPMFDGKYLASEGGVIVVTIAYRLGALGFLYLDGESAPGNQGLFDQTLALKWVHDNIESFGGDSNQITIFGSSAGGSSTAFHLFSAVSSDYFNRAIIQSSDVKSILNLEIGDTPSFRDIGFKYAVDVLGCPNSTDPQVISDCLRKVAPEKIAKTQNYLPILRTFMPVVDRHFLPDSPRKLLEEGKVKRCPIVCGTVAAEGTYFVFQMLPSLDLPNGTMDGAKAAASIPILFQYYTYYPNIRNPTFTNDLIDLYANKQDPDNTEKNLEAVSNMLASTMFTCPLDELAEFYAVYGEEVYKYVLTQRYARNPWPQWMNVVHGDDIFFVFGAPPSPGLEFVGDEILLNKAIITYWSNFAKTG